MQFGHVEWSLLGYVLLGSVTGMVLGVRADTWVSPVVMRRVTASITISIAGILIVVNLAKLAGWLG